jgi:hypothetical protein
MDPALWLRPNPRAHRRRMPAGKLPAPPVWPRQTPRGSIHPCICLPSPVAPCARARARTQRRSAATRRLDGPRLVCSGPVPNRRRGALGLPLPASRARAGPGPPPGAARRPRADGPGAAPCLTGRAPMSDQQLCAEPRRWAPCRPRRLPKAAQHPAHVWASQAARHWRVITRARTGLGPGLGPGPGPLNRAAAHVFQCRRRRGRRPSPAGRLVTAGPLGLFLGVIPGAKDGGAHTHVGGTHGNLRGRGRGAGGRG